ncbi:MAG TPA: type II restriction endonuclease [Blastocatellia bacterium]|nr:type II restriction endonuclease [Blastocatellia bacterium]
MQSRTRKNGRFATLFISLLLAAAFASAQAQAPAAAVERGSATAKGGFRNENDIRDKFINWREDGDARAWLTAIGYDTSTIKDVTAVKPSGEKADVVVTVTKSDGAERRHGISIKLVSSPNGFNQIDKRWLRQYAKMWNILPEIVAALRLFVGEDPPVGKTRRPERMFLTELSKEVQAAVVGFFSANKEQIVADLLRGEGTGRADLFMVAWKPGRETRWKIVTTNEAIRFFGDGPVEITQNGNLKIGRITMQRKGGDGGRETAKMLQFKMNPSLVFEMK